jgi:hypothetical protein
VVVSLFNVYPSLASSALVCGFLPSDVKLGFKSGLDRRNGGCPVRSLIRLTSWCLVAEFLT